LSPLRDTVGEKDGNKTHHELQRDFIESVNSSTSLDRARRSDGPY
jgi:hypothetical protein